MVNLTLAAYEDVTAHGYVLAAGHSDPPPGRD
jgi:hypothetical protein